MIKKILGFVFGNKKTQKMLLPIGDADIFLKDNQDWSLGEQNDSDMEKGLIWIEKSLNK